MKNNSYIITEVYPLVDLQVWVDIIRMQTETLPSDLVKLPDDGNWFIIYNNEKPVAYAGLVDFDKQSKPKKKKRTDMCFFTRCGVREGHRGKGLQRDLIFHRICKAKAIGYSSIITTTYENPSSSNNLINAGFKLYTPETTWGIDGTNYWWLNLQSKEVK